jgi:hypothetical protein
MLRPLTSTLPPWLSLFWLAALVLALSAGGGKAFAGGDSGCCCQTPRPGCLIGAPRPQDDVWLLSTRSLGCASKDWSPYVAEFEACAWQPRELTELVTAAEAVTTIVIYVHGNGVDPAQAKQLGWTAYDGVARGARDDERLLFVIWSWPSEMGRRPLRAVRENYVRAETDAIYFSQFVQQLPLTARLSLFGFSLGGKVITGGLSDLADADPMAGGRDIRVVLHSPGVSNQWLYPGRPHGSYGLAADHTLLMYNPCDPVLKRFRFIDPCSRPEALGYTGLGSPSSLDGEGLFEQQNTSGTIGRSHSSYDYLHSPSLMDATRSVLLE